MTVVAHSIASAPMAAGPLAGAPAEYALPASRPTLAQAKAWCRHLATSHYENFHVATWFLPKLVRPYFESIYAFSRVADDLGDEVADTHTALRLLAEWRSMLAECYNTPALSVHPVFVALRETIDETGVPQQLFDDLISAFEMDQRNPYHPSIESLVDYARYSANPVGRLVLWVSGYRDQQRALLSDKMCTALQLINFWQDVVEDWGRGRRYIPTDAMQRFSVTDQMIAERQFTPEFDAMMHYLVDLAGNMLSEGGVLCSQVDSQLAITLRLFEGGGRAALNGIIAQRYDVLQSRPSVSRGTKLRLLTSAMMGKTAAFFRSSAKTGISA